MNLRIATETSNERKHYNNNDVHLAEEYLISMNNLIMNKRKITLSIQATYFDTLPNKKFICGFFSINETLENSDFLEGDYSYGRTMNDAILSFYEIFKKLDLTDYDDYYM